MKKQTSVMSPINHIERLKADRTTSVANLARYAYLLAACEFPASVVGSAQSQKISYVCRLKLTEINDELHRRFSIGEDRSAAIINALIELSPYNVAVDVAQERNTISLSWRENDDRDTLMCVLGSLSDIGFEKRDALRRKISRWIGQKIKSGNTGNILFFEVAWRYIRTTGSARRRRQVLSLFDAFLNSCDLSSLTTAQLIRLHALSRLWYELRHEKGLETFTRYYQQNIVSELKRREAADRTTSLQPQLLYLAETLEAENHADLLGLMFDGEVGAQIFNPASCRNDAALIRHIKTLSASNTYIARENLVRTADYILDEIVSKDKADKHMELIRAILAPVMSNLRYPKIASVLTNTPDTLSKTGSRPLPSSHSYNQSAL